MGSSPINEEKLQQSNDEYLKNLWFQYHYSCHQENNAEGCDLLADYHKNILRDLPASQEQYKQNCEKHNYAPSCKKFAVGNIRDKKNYQESYQYLKNYCDQNDIDACYYAAKLALSPNPLYSKEVADTKRQTDEGIKYLRKFCDKFPENNSCLTLVFHYTNDKESKENLRKAYEISLKSCEKMNASGCMFMSKMYSEGMWVQRDDKMADIFKTYAKKFEKKS